MEGETTSDARPWRGVEHLPKAEEARARPAIRTEAARSTVGESGLVRAARQAKRRRKPAGSRGFERPGLLVNGRCTRQGSDRTAHVARWTDPTANGFTDYVALLDARESGAGFVLVKDVRRKSKGCHQPSGRVVDELLVKKNWNRQKRIRVVT